jgi:hypothetical protein
VNAEVVPFPRRAASVVSDVVTAPLVPFVGSGTVDEWGRDQQAIALLRPFTSLRWNVSVGGVHHVPSRTGALLVANARRWSLSTVYASLALSEAAGRPVRFVGRPDISPVGPFMRRIGGLLARPDEVEEALREHQLVVVSTAATRNPRHAGAVDPAYIRAAMVAGVSIHPLACTSSPIARGARVEVGPVQRTRRKRRGPLAEIEMADAVQHHLQRMLDGLGGLQTGVAGLDFWAEG